MIYTTIQMFWGSNIFNIYISIYLKMYFMALSMLKTVVQFIIYLFVEIMIAFPQDSLMNKVQKHLYETEI